MNKRFFSSLTILGVALAFVLSLGAVNPAKAVPGFNENRNQYDPGAAPTIIGNDQSDRIVGDRDMDGN